MFLSDAAIGLLMVITQSKGMLEASHRRLESDRDTTRIQGKEETEEREREREREKRKTHSLFLKRRYNEILFYILIRTSTYLCKRRNQVI